MEREISYLRNVYAGLTGICVAFFFALLSSQNPPTGWLLMSSVCFGIALPIFVSFLVFHIVVAESGIDSQRVGKVISTKRIKRLTNFSFIVLFLASISLAFHFSILIGLFMLISAIVFFSELNEALNSFITQ